MEAHHEIMGRDDKEFVESLARGLSVIEAFDAETPEMSLSDIARKIGHSPATARRSIRTLVTLGYMRQAGRKFGLAPKVLLLGSAYFRATHIEDALLPELRDIVARFGDAASVGVLADRNVLYVAHQTAQHGLRPVAGTGMTYPAYATSLGRVLLASLPSVSFEDYLAIPLRPLTDMTVTDPQRFRELIARVRGDGYATAVDQLSYGVSSLAVPVRLRSGETVAALNSSGYSGRVTPDTLVAERLEALLATALKIAEVFERHPVLLHSLGYGRADTTS